MILRVAHNPARFWRVVPRRRRLERRPGGHCL